MGVQYDSGEETEKRALVDKKINDIKYEGEDAAWVDETGSSKPSESIDWIDALLSGKEADIGDNFFKNYPNKTWQQLLAENEAYKAQNGSA